MHELEAEELVQKCSQILFEQIDELIEEEAVDILETLLSYRRQYQQWQRVDWVNREYRQESVSPEQVCKLFKIINASQILEYLLEASVNDLSPDQVISVIDEIYEKRKTSTNEKNRDSVIEKESLVRCLRMIIRQRKDLPQEQIDRLADDQSGIILEATLAIYGSQLSSKKIARIAKRIGHAYS